MRRLDRLQELLDAWGIKYFKAKELVIHKNPRWRGDRYTVPPDDIIQNIEHTIKAADKIRERFGEPIRIVSGYRSPEYNDLVGGARRSQHKSFRALDMMPLRGRGLDRLKKIAKQVMDELGQEGISTGYGTYRSFVHIDTGAVKFRRRWKG